MRRYVVEQFFPVDGAWERWLTATAGPTLGGFDRKPHDIVEDGRGGVALVIYKRGGTAKAVPVLDDVAPAPTLIHACEQAALRRERRKLSMFLPVRAAGPAAYRRELHAIGYSVRGPIAVWSRSLV